MTEILVETDIKFLCIFFWASGGGSPLYPEILQYYTMILQRIRIIVVDAGFEPGTSAPEVWRATNEPPHLGHLCHFILEVIFTTLL